MSKMDLKDSIPVYEIFSTDTLSMMLDIPVKLTIVAVIFVLFFAIPMGDKSGRKKVYKASAWTALAVYLILSVMLLLNIAPANKILKWEKEYVAEYINELEYIEDVNFEVLEMNKRENEAKVGFIVDEKYEESTAKLVYKEDVSSMVRYKVMDVDYSKEIEKYAPIGIIYPEYVKGSPYEVELILDKKDIGK